MRAAKFTDRSPTWIKPSAIANVLKDYRFIVFFDADAIVNQIQIPMEWLFNYWDINKRISLAMVLDPDGPEGINNDTNGRVYTNTSFIILHNKALSRRISSARGMNVQMTLGIQAAHRGKSPGFTNSLLLAPTFGTTTTRTLGSCHALRPMESRIAKCVQVYS